MDTLNKPLNFNSESWDLFCADSDQYEKDWDNDAASVAADFVDPSTTNAFEVKS